MSLAVGGVGEATAGIIYGSGAILGSAEAMTIGAAAGTAFGGATAAIGFGVGSARAFQQGDTAGRNRQRGWERWAEFLLVASLFTPAG